MEDYEIVYAADDGFASIMGVSLLSLLKNNQDLENLRVTIFNSGISDENKEKIEEIFRKYVFAATLVAASIITFLMLSILPGNAARVALGIEATDAQVAAQEQL